MQNLSLRSSCFLLPILTTIFRVQFSFYFVVNVVSQFFISLLVYLYFHTFTTIHVLGYTTDHSASVINLLKNQLTRIVRQTCHLINSSFQLCSKLISRGQFLMQSGVLITVISPTTISPTGVRETKMFVILMEGVPVKVAGICDHLDPLNPLQATPRWFVVYFIFLCL